ncbi:Pycsar system effector family protein [Streptomyces sp. NPDC101249]|uniref:Pycsar system effector family protein n=1 Tax=Streptomyces sp. NPDC101249 TaxID=3366140 RepID=UPI0037F290B2
MDRESVGAGGAREGHRAPDVVQAWQVLALVDDAAKHSDAKAGVMLAATGLIGSALYRVVGSWGRPGPIPVTCVAVGTVLLLCTGVCAGLCILPRTRYGRCAPSASSIHFEQIARCHPSAASYVGELAALTVNRDALFRDVASQAWGMAHVVSRKFRWCHRAIRSLLLALLFVAMSVVTHGF